MANIAFKATLRSPLPLLHRCKSSKAGYDSNILSGPNAKAAISHVRPGGFVVGGYRVNGPIVLFDGIFLQWKLTSMEEVTEESLRLITLLNPKPEILVLGTGDTQARVSPKILTFLKSHGILVEIQPSKKASATYNFFVEEGRVTAAALFPPTKV